MCGAHQNENYQCCRDCLPLLMSTSMSKGRNNTDAMYARQETLRAKATGKSDEQRELAPEEVEQVQRRGAQREQQNSGPILPAKGGVEHFDLRDGEQADDEEYDEDGEYAAAHEAL